MKVPIRHVAVLLAAGISVIAAPTLAQAPRLGDFEIQEELTEFSLADDVKSWWIPSNRPRLDRSEMLYSSSPMSLIDSVQTPLTMATRDGKTVVVIHEANLVNYARMNIRGGRMENRTLHAALAPWVDGVKVRGPTRFVRPNANWLTNPLPVTISKQPMTSASRLHVVLAPGGGQAVRIRPAGSTSGGQR